MRQNQPVWRSSNFFAQCARGGGVRKSYFFETTFAFFWSVWWWRMVIQWAPTLSRHFRQLAMLAGKNGSKPLARLSPFLIQLWSILIQPFGVSRAAYGPILPIYGNFGLFLAISIAQNVEKMWALIGSPFSTIRRTRKMQKLFQKSNFFWPPPL